MIRANLAVWAPSLLPSRWPRCPFDLGLAVLRTGLLMLLVAGAAGIAAQLGTDVYHLASGDVEVWVEPAELAAGMVLAALVAYPVTSLLTVRRPEHREARR